MPGLIMSINKLGLTSGLFVIICILIISTTAGLHKSGSKVIERIKESAKDTTNHLCNNDSPVFGQSSLGDILFKLYEPIRHPITDSTYTDAAGKIHEVKEDAPWWTEPLKNQVLIVDIDTRIPNKKGELWNEDRMNWEAMSPKGDGGMVSASFMNHFFYGLYHPVLASNAFMLTCHSTNTWL